MKNIVNDKSFIKNNQEIKNTKVEINPIVNNKRENGVSIDFRNFIHSPLRFANFTNYPKNQEEHKKIYDIFFQKFLPHIYGKKFSELEKENHTHIVREDKYNLIKSILEMDTTKGKEILCSWDKLIDQGTTIWQFAAPGGMRVISFRSAQHIGILFLDPYHLLYPNDTYNCDYKNYTYIPTISRKEDLTIVSIENELLDKCLNCDIFNEIILKNN